MRRCNIPGARQGAKARLDGTGCAPWCRARTMRRTWRTIRRALGAPLTALVLGAGTAGPYMDAADLFVGARLGSSEDARSARAGHDHRLCIQVGANAPLASHPALPPVLWPIRTHAVDEAAPAWLPPGEPAAPTARAPPSR